MVSVPAWPADDREMDELHAAMRQAAEAAALSYFTCKTGAAHSSDAPDATMPASARPGQSP